jgi:microtubule-associated protein 1 light chain
MSNKNNINDIKITNTVEEKGTLPSIDVVGKGTLPSKKVKIDYTKTNFTEEEKISIRNEVDIIKQQYPGYIPIIVRTRKNDKGIVLTKSKFLVTNEITLAQFLIILRKKISDIKSTESIFLLIDNTMVPVTLTMASIYKEKRDNDTNMLFITVCKENTFGQ